MTRRAFTRTDTPLQVTLIPGDGIGAEITDSVKEIFEAVNAPIEWEQYDVSGMSSSGEALFKQAMESLKRNRRWIVRDAAAENGIRVASLASTYATGPSRCCEAEVYAMDYHDLLRFSPCYGEIVILMTIRGELNVEWYDN